MKTLSKHLLTLTMLLLSHLTLAGDWPFEVTVEGNPTLPKMILIPGLAGSGDVWQSTVAHYKGRFQTHTLTLKGFAGVPTQSPATLEQIRDDIIRYAQVKGLTRPVIVGHSLGGFMALRIAIAKPNLPGKIVIVDSLPFLPAAQNPMATEQSVKPYAQMMRKQFVDATDAAAFAARQRQSLMTLVKDKNGLEKALKWSLDSDKKMVGESVYQLMTTDLRKSIEQIKTPTLILGSWAAYASFGATLESTKGVFESQYRLLKNKTIAMAPKAYHFIMFDSPKWMLAQTDNFLL